jgi:membrane protease YdiL (CAAX protease family)
VSSTDHSPGVCGRTVACTPALDHGDSPCEVEGWPAGPATSSGGGCGHDDADSASRGSGSGRHRRACSSSAIGRRGLTMRILGRHPLITFFVLAVGATWAVWIPRALGVPVGAVGQLWTWTVALVAAVVALLTGGRGALRELFSRVVRWRVGWRWYVVVVLGPALFAALVAGLGTVLGGARDEGNPVGFTGSDWVALPMFLLVAALTDGLGEELGWRGFALPRLLSRQTPLMASLVLGAIWAAWHLPLVWTSGAVLHQRPLWLLFPDLMAKAMLFTWVFLHTRGSVLIAVLLHASMNVFAIPLAATSAGHEALPLVAVVIEWGVVAAVVLSARPSFVRRVRDPELLAQSTVPLDRDRSAGS